MNNWSVYYLKSEIDTLSILFPDFLLSFWLQPLENGIIDFQECPLQVNYLFYHKE